MIKIDFQKLIAKNIPKELKQPHRSQIYVGFQCHQKCGFCYYKDRYAEPMFNREYVLRQIDLELAYGITDFEITGGEPSECKDLIFYCKYIKDKLPTSKIAIITNGGLWKNNDVWKYIDEVLVSYHISKACKNIDRIMFPLGNTYDKVEKTIYLAKKFGKLVRTNTVIGTFNLDDVDQIVDDLIVLNPSIINFLPVNLFDGAYDMGVYIDYNKLRPILKRSIDRLKNLLSNTLIFIRYMPFCDMEGYEQHILGTWQHMYDWFDWNPELCGKYLLNFLDKYQTNSEILEQLGQYGSKSLYYSYDCINAHYEKNYSCINCKYYIICDGVEKTKNNILLDQIIPCKGKLIKNPMEFLKISIQKKYFDYYG